MKRIFQYMATLLLLLVVGTSCEEGNDNWRIITAIQTGTYIVGDATIYSAAATSAQLTTPAFDPQETNANVVGIYTWLKKSGSFQILDVDAEGNQVTYGKGSVVASTTFETVEMTTGGSGFTVANDGLYYIVCNKADKQLSILPAEFGIIGDATPKLWNDETAMNGTLDEEHSIIEYVIKDVTLDKKEMKFRYLHSWGVEIPYQGGTVKIHSNMGGLSKAGLSEAYSECKGGGENFSIGKAGIYDITLKLDLRTGVFSAKGVCTAEDTSSATLPEKMFITGDAWDWKWENAPEMIPVHSHDGMFWGIYYIEANKGVKFNNEMSWSTGNNFGVEKDEPKGYGEYPAGGSNLVVNKSAYYQIVVVCELSADKKSVNRKVILSEPIPYLIGEAAAGGWEAQLADADKFTLNEDGEYVSPACKAGNLRMCVKLNGCDWWQTEFNVFNGMIVFRGKDGDQAAVAVAAGQVVKLNFKNNTGSIK